MAWISATRATAELMLIVRPPRVRSRAEWRPVSRRPPPVTLDGELVEGDGVEALHLEDVLRVAALLAALERLALAGALGEMLPPLTHLGVALGEVLGHLTAVAVHPLQIGVGDHQVVSGRTGADGVEMRLAGDVQLLESILKLGLDPQAVTERRRKLLARHVL